MPKKTDRLERYLQKRVVGKTPEPFGSREVPSTGRLFVFHKHHARNLHWDLRLEWEGALESWAVPKGPSPDPAEKRLAMHVEPHPLDYAEFEGVIPEGEYGAGPSIVWDKGIWIPREDVAQGFEKGKLLFDLRGFKVKGLWTLVHTPKAGENHWLLIKERDGHVDSGGTSVYPDDSIYSGLEVDVLPEARQRASSLAAQALELGAKRRRVSVRKIEVMKATARIDAFSDPAWIFELKYDGYRLLAGCEEADGVLISRNGNDLTDTFPEIARAVKGLLFEGLLMDGEIVVHDQNGLPSFDRLQRRSRIQRRSDIARATLELPAVYYAFDLLALEGLDLRRLPLLERKRLLQELLPTVGPIRYSEHIAERGETMYAQVGAMGLEGIVAKRATSAYTGGRSRDWYKIPALRSDDFVVVGWTEPKGTRGSFGALHLAQFVDGELTYAGSVGTGFTDAELTELHTELKDLEAASHAELAGPVPRGKQHHWIRPELVIEVRYRELTDQGMVRHGVFVRVRDDKKPGACVRQDPGKSRKLPDPPPVQREERTIAFTNLDKVYFPEDGYTKGDLIEYYRRISPWLLPWLRDRPVVLTRYPDGIHGKSFYQKDTPEWTPAWVRTETIGSEGSDKALDYFVADDLGTVLYLANLGSIPLHIWHSRASKLHRPDWCLLDLDPKDAPFSDVVEVALLLHALCDEIGLPHYVKTTGSSGLHILIPLGGQMDYDQSVTLGNLLARLVVQTLPKILTVERTLRKREGKVTWTTTRTERAS